MTLADLRTLVARRAGGAVGQIDSKLPGLWFFRSLAPADRVKKSAPTMCVAFILEGAKRMTFPGLELVYAPGEYIVVTRETDYEAEIVRAPYLSLALELPPELVLEMLMALPEGEVSNGEVPAACLSKVEPELIGALCRLVRSLEDGTERAVLAPLIVRELVFRLLRSEWAGLLRRVARGNGDERRIRQALAFIQASFTKRLTVEQIARHVRMSPSHFAHRFRDFARTSPMRYVKHLRLHRARILMLEGARAGEAAESVGYQSASHFNRDFKSYFGAPPGSYVRTAQDPATQTQDSTLAGSGRARKVPA